MADTTTRLLRRLLDEPEHVRAVRALEPSRFVSMVRSVGLEDAGELLAMATPEQTLELLDAQLWRIDAGSPTERLDASRFVVWLEVLLEGGDAAAARRLREVPEELLTAGLLSQLFVLGPEALGHDLAGASWEHAELAERVLDETLHLELDGFTMVARSELGWDPTVAALLALDVVDHERVERILDRCRSATAEELADEEDDGLHVLLSAHETAEVDALADREDRRARRGYVSVADARAFLALAERTTTHDPAGLEEDPITRACLRELEPAKRPGISPPSGSRTRPPRALTELLDHVEALEAGPRPALPSGPEPAPEERATARLRAALHELAATDPVRHGEQLTRLAFLANVLVTHGLPDGGPCPPVEAGDRALRAVARGLDAMVGVDDDALAVLGRTGVDVLFRVGWRASSDQE